MVKAGPDEYLLVGRGGTLQNRGSAVSVVLRPGTIHVLVPSTKQEAAFEFTQETNDGIPLRFKGIIIFRITDPVAAARQFDFSHGGGLARITTLLTHVCLGELRHAVSRMSMVECIEQRKTTLSGAPRRLGPDATVAAILCDSGVKYLSTEVSDLTKPFAAPMPRPGRTAGREVRPRGRSRTFARSSP